MFLSRDWQRSGYIAISLATVRRSDICPYSPTGTYVACKLGQFAILVYICEFQMQFIFLKCAIKW